MKLRHSLIALALAACCGTISAAETYRVARGDTLYDIAKRYQISVREIQALNNLRSPRIQAGQLLQIPGTGAGVTADVSYTVRRGDSLSVIASRHGVSVGALKSHNRLRTNLLHPGQVLFIPDGDNATRSASAQRVATVHRVRRGDTLWDISKRYRVSVASLSRFNSISKTVALMPGQEIRIPASATLSPGGVSGTSRVATSTKGLYTESRSIIVVDAQSGTPLFEKNADEIKSIASITKLMTAMVTLDAKLDLEETLTIDRGDVDRLKMTSSRLPLGTRLSRYDMLHLALMSSENRAASALSRHYPGGHSAFLEAMNRKARELGMTNTHFADATGLNPKNVSTAADLARMVAAASQYPLISQFTTDHDELVRTNKTGALQYRNTNVLVRQGKWNIGVSKTGYINEAGRCLVMQAEIGNRAAYMVFLKSGNRAAPGNDAKRIKKWVESGAAGINLAGL